MGEPIEASESLVHFARLAQQARLTPPSGQNESQEGQAIVGKSEVANQKMEFSMAEQGAGQQAEEASLEEAEAQAMKWWEVLQANRKNHEREARAEARLLEEAESQAGQTKQLKEQAEARALQNEQMKEWRHTLRHGLRPSS